MLLCFSSVTFAAERAQVLDRVGVVDAGSYQLATRAWVMVSNDSGRTAQDAERRAGEQLGSCLLPRWAAVAARAGRALTGASFVFASRGASQAARPPVRATAVRA